MAAVWCHSFGFINARLFQSRYFSRAYQITCHRGIFNGGGTGSGSSPINGFDFFDEPLEKMWSFQDKDGSFMNETPARSKHAIRDDSQLTGRQLFIRNAKSDAKRVLEILQKDSPWFVTKAALGKLGLRVSGLLVREVLLGILRSSEHASKKWCAKLGFNFFVWSSLQENYKHTANSYHLMIELFVVCEEFKAMWGLVNEMTEKGLPTTARTFNILIRTCSEVGLAKRMVEQFIKSRNFNFLPFKHSYNAILHCLIRMRQYKLIEWVYQLMLADGHSADILTYNVMMFASYRLGKFDKFLRFYNEMCTCGYSPDFHTYSILLHVLGKGNRPLVALDLLNKMKKVGFEPNVVHITTLMDGLRRAGNLDACRYFFDQMIKYACIPDVVCYTVIITGYIVVGELEKAKELFDEMVTKGQLPNVFTYNSMIRGFCMAGRFSEAFSLFKEMEERGCNPNFLVYSTMVNNLRNAGKFAEANVIIRRMVEQGQYTHIISKFKRRRH